MCYGSHSLMPSSSKLKPTSAQYLLKNYSQHPKKSYFPAIQIGMRLTFRVHQMAWGEFDHLRKKAQKSVEKFERKY